MVKWLRCYANIPSTFFICWIVSLTRNTFHSLSLSLSLWQFTLRSRTQLTFSVVVLYVFSNDHLLPSFLIIRSFFSLSLSLCPLNWCRAPLWIIFWMPNESALECSNHFLDILFVFFVENCRHRCRCRRLRLRCHLYYRLLQFISLHSNRLNLNLNEKIKYFSSKINNKLMWSISTSFPWVKNVRWAGCFCVRCRTNYETARL